MTPELRAARDRITAYLDRRTPELHDRIAYSGPGRDFVALFASDLRTVLTALDRYEAWDEAARQDARQVAAEAGFAVGSGRDITVTWTAAHPPTIEKIEELRRNWCHEQPVAILTDSATYPTADEDGLTTALRNEVHSLGCQLHAVTEERDLWAARTRKLLGEKSGRLATDPESSDLSREDTP